VLSPQVHDHVTRMAVAAGAGADSFHMNSCSSSAKFRALDSADFLRAECVQQNPGCRKKFCSTRRPKGYLQPGETILGVVCRGFRTSLSHSRGVAC
jgi:hypothetical protein